MTYAELWALRTSPSLLSRFTVSVETTVHAIFVEDPATANHANRVAWAKRAFFATDAAQRYADMIRRIAVVSDAGLQSAGESVTDAAIQAIVNSYADQLASAGL